MDDEAAFRQAFADCYEDLHLFVLRRAPHSDSQAIVADTFVTAWEKWASRPQLANEVRPWMFGIAHNTLRNSERREVRRPRLEAQHTYEVSHPIEPDPSHFQVRTALATLSLADQAVLQLTAWEGLSSRELAIALGTNERAVRVRLYRARRRLASALNASAVASISPRPMSTPLHKHT